jgi:UDP-glucuronate 4-epimerase
MAYYKFARAILESQPIEIYNNGEMFRDFTYIDDIVEGIVAAINSIPPKIALYNLGNNRSEKLTDFVDALENALGRNAQRIYAGMQAGDVPITMADINITREKLGWEPKTMIKDGLKQFVDWFLKYNLN